ncbi:MAG: acyl-CoA dehydrogenase, partial [Deltaproteobacteria bacterium]|nr:acyl-CoA dehydrogenase [Deltaproteobacteria bacterium]
MENFYKDNEDIQFFFTHLDWSRIVTLQEQNFQDRERYDYAPENTEDAVDNYKRVLSVLGEIAAEYIAPRSEQV